MKILQVVHCFPPQPVGGTERVALGLARGLAARGHELSVLSGSLEWDRGFRAEQELFEGIPVFRISRDDPWFDRWDNGYHPDVERLFRERLRALKPDLVHVHHWIRLTRNLVQVCREENIPAAVQLHDFHATCPRTFRIRPNGRFCTLPPGRTPCLPCVERWPFQGDAEVAAHLEHYLRDLLAELRGAHLRLAPSAAHAAALASFLLGEAGPIDLLPPGREVELAPLRPRQRKPGTLALAHWGNLYDLKGTLLLLEALAIARERADLRLTVLGGAMEESFGAKLEARLAGLPATWTGAYDPKDLEALEADAAVFPSLCHESYGLVLDEAFMLGLPVVVSALGALPERAGGAGLVVPPGDARALADALVRLATEPGLLDTLAANIPRSWSTEAEAAARAEGLYEEVLAGRRTPLPPQASLTHFDRLRLAWFTAAMRLASLGGSVIDSPPPWRAEGGGPGGA